MQVYMEGNQKNTSYVMEGLERLEEGICHETLYKIETTQPLAQPLATPPQPVANQLHID